MKLGTLVITLPVIIAVTLVYLPQFWIYVFMTIDYLTPWKIFESPTFDAYHDFLISRLHPQPELPIPELHANNFTKEDILRLSKGFTFPVVIREVLVNSSGVKEWSNPQWWLDNYKDEGILCGTLNDVRPSCTIGDFFDEIKNGNPFYVSGASKIFTNNPPLAAMVEDERLKQLEPSERVSTQLFMGLPKMGSDIHSAIGVNIFRQMTGVKKWWFIPPSQTAFLKPSFNVNGFSAHTHTLVGKGNEKESEWMNKLVRYTAVLQPGDVLINPPWFWHGILNSAEKPNDLIIGVPTRYSGLDGLVAAIKSNPYMTFVAISVIMVKYGGLANFKAAGDVLEDKIQANRVARMAKGHD